MVHDGWIQKSLEEIIFLEYGKALKESDRTNGTIDVYGSNGVIGTHNKLWLKAPGIVIGRKGTVGSVVWAKRDFWAIDTTYYINLKQEVELRWLYFMLSQLKLERLTQATGSPGLNRNDVYRQNIALPPLSEQKKIAEILSSVDEAIASTQAVINQTRKVKQGLLQQLLTRGIGHTKFKESAIGKIPVDWKVIDLNEITKESAFGPRFSGELYDANGNYGSVRTTDIDDNWEVNYETVPRAILPESQCEKHRLIDGDLLVTRSGSCGIVCVFKEQPIPMIPGAFIIRFRLKDNVNPEFVRLSMMTPNSQASIAMMAAGGVQKNLSGTNLKKLILPLPSLDEQNKIVSLYNDVLHSEKSSQENLWQLEQIKNGLMQDLLTGRVRIKNTELI